MSNCCWSNGISKPHIGSALKILGICREGIRVVFSESTLFEKCAHQTVLNSCTYYQSKTQLSSFIISWPTKPTLKEGKFIHESLLACMYNRQMKKEMLSSFNINILLLEWANQYTDQLVRVVVYSNLTSHQKSMSCVDRTGRNTRGAEERNVRTLAEALTTSSCSCRMYVKSMWRDSNQHASNYMS